MKPSDGSGLSRPINHTAGPCPSKKHWEAYLVMRLLSVFQCWIFLISTWLIIPHPDQTVNNRLASGKLVACGPKQHHPRLLVGFFFLSLSQIFAVLFPKSCFCCNPFFLFFSPT